MQALARRALTAEALERSNGAEARETHKVASEHLRMLVAGIGGGRKVAIPLSSVTRLENIPTVRGRAASAAARSSSTAARSCRCVRLDRHLGAMSERDGDDLVVVVYTAGGRSVAIVVDEIVDIVDEESEVRSDIDDHGLLGSTLIRDRIVEVLDVRAAILAADPKFYTAPEFEVTLDADYQEAM